MRAQELKSSLCIEIIIPYGTVKLLARDQLCNKNSQKNPIKIGKKY